MADEATSETTTTETTTEVTTPDGTDRDEAFKHRLAKEREKWEKENAETFTKAKQHDELLESQKTEAQKAIDAANKQTRDIAKQFEDYKRDLLLTKVPEDKRDGFKDKSSSEIESALALAALLTPSESRNEPPKPRGKERFVTGSGERPEPDEDIETIVKDLF